MPAASRIALPDGGILYREGGAVRAGGVDRRLAASSLSVRIAWTRPLIMAMNSGVLARRLGGLPGVSRPGERAEQHVRHLSWIFQVRLMRHPGQLAVAGTRQP